MRAFAKLLIVVLVALGFPVYAGEAVGPADAGHGQSVLDQNVAFAPRQNEAATDGFDELSKVEQESRGKSTVEKAVEIGNAYDRIFGHVDAEDLSSLSDGDLQALFQATHVVMFYSMREKDLGRLEVIYQELDSRALSNEQDQEDVYGAYVSMRRFSEAESLRVKWGRDDLERIPFVLQQIDSAVSSPTTLDFEDGRTLRRTALSLGQGPHIVIISHPLCHFSRNAVYAIEASVEAAEMILEHAIWLAPVDRQLRLDVLRRWNQEHPEAEMRIAYKRDEWPMLDSWSTPTFYFFKDGVLETEVAGWPEEGMMSQLLDAARLIGIESKRYGQEQK